MTAVSSPAPDNAISTRPLAAGELLELDPSTVRIAPTGNDRTVFTEAELEELADSIDRVGQLTPITVRTLADGALELVAGERRLRACARRGRPVLARVSELDDAGAWEAMLEENLARVDLDPIDEARAMMRRGTELGLTLADIARRWRRSPAYCADRIALLGLDPSLQELVRLGELSIGAGASLSQLTPEEQRRAVREGCQEMTQEQVRRLVSGMVAIREQLSMFEASAGAELTSAEYDSRLSCYVDAMRAPGRDAGSDLVGPTEIAERLGVKRSTVLKWRERYADFPAPRAIIGEGRPGPAGKASSSGTPIWNWSDVQDWAITTGRTLAGGAK